jgi:hypothetical protein
MVRRTPVVCVDDEQERRILPPEPQRYLVAPGCRRCGGSGLRECEIEGHDMPETIESLQQRIEELEASQRPRAYSAAPPTPPASASVKSVMDE